MIISAEELQAYSVFDRVKNRSVETSGRYY